jgi:FkbM family methyltransferase
MSTLKHLVVRGYNGVNKLLARRLIDRLVTYRSGQKLEKLGAGDGAWSVPLDRLGDHPVCYCVGIGIDASFDIALSERGAQVFSFDPTPRSIDYMVGICRDHPGITFLPLGVWNENKTLFFHAPWNEAHANFSIANIHATTSGFSADCRRLSSIMQTLGHSRIDLLKIDIEGSWREVLDDMLLSKVLVSSICVEFDTPTSLFKAVGMIRRLGKAGFVPVLRERDNFVFMHQRILPPQMA